MRFFSIILFLIGNSVAFSRADAFTYEDLVALIENGHYTKIEEVLPKLPESFRSNYVLLHQSNSLHGASPENPRVILFGEDAKLTCSFNGDSEHKGNDIIECFQFRDLEKKFDFYQILFPTERNQFPRVVFSLLNRAVARGFQCTSCHGDDPRPNWETYPKWPGAYGALDDRLDEESEKTNYAKFVALRANHPRYRHLIQDSDPEAPYMTEGRTFVSRRPNLRFSDLVGRMNGLRTGRILASKVPVWKQWEFVVGGLTGPEGASCKLSEEQKRAIAHLPEPTFDLKKIFELVGVRDDLWGTPFLVGPPPERPFEHQSGFSFLSIDTAMAIIMKRVNDGDQGLRDAVANIKFDESDPDTSFRKKLYEILPDPDYFGRYSADNLNLFCPEVTKTFVDEYLRQ